VLSPDGPGGGAGPGTHVSVGGIDELQ